MTEPQPHCQCRTQVATDKCAECGDEVCAVCSVPFGEGRLCGVNEGRLCIECDAIVPGAEVMSDCQQCGQCCKANGLIPPLLLEPGERPGWLVTLVSNLRRHFGAVAEDFPCLFLSNDQRCAIHDVKPDICNEFACDKDGFVKVTVVHWEDSRFPPQGWIDEESVEMECATPTTIGHPVKETKEVLCIAASHDKGNGNVAGLVYIPQRSIIWRMSVAVEEPK